MNGNFLSPFLSPLLNSLGSLWFVVLVSLFVSLLTIIVYKFTTDQTLMKSIRDDLKKMQDQMKKSMHDQKKVAALQKEMMDKQWVMMRHSFTSTLITMLPIIVLFGWLTAHLSFVPIQQDVQFTVDVTFDDYVGNVTLMAPKEITVVGSVTKPVASNVEWRLSGKTGEYLLEWNVGDKTYTKEVVITSEQAYADSVKVVNDGVVKQITINYKKNIILNLFGWKLGWLGSYIIFALIFSMILRKLLKVY